MTHNTKQFHIHQNTHKRTNANSLFQHQASFEGSTQLNKPMLLYDQEIIFYQKW